MSRTTSEILQANERLRAASGVVINLGAALFATAAGRWFLTGFDAYVALWLIGGLGIIAVGLAMLSFLESEIPDG